MVLVIKKFTLKGVNDKGVFVTNMIDVNIIVPRIN